MMRRVHEGDWIAASNGDLSSGERKLVENRDRIEVWGEIQDAEASYSYDDWALIRLDGDWYLLNTSGCSCPSPDETWGIAHGPCTLDEIETAVKDGDYPGYSVPGRQLDEFLSAIAEARKATDESPGEKLDA